MITKDIQKKNRCELFPPDVPHTKGLGLPFRKPGLRHLLAYQFIEVNKTLAARLLWVTWERSEHFIY